MQVPCPFAFLTDYFAIDSLPAWRQWVLDIMQAAGSAAVYAANSRADVLFEFSLARQLLQAAAQLAQQPLCLYRYHHGLQVRAGRALECLRLFFRYQPLHRWLQELQLLRSYCLRAQRMPARIMDRATRCLWLLHMLESVWILAGQPAPCARGLAA